MTAQWTIFFLPVSIIEKALNCNIFMKSGNTQQSTRNCALTFVDASVCFRTLLCSKSRTLSRPPSPVNVECSSGSKNRNYSQNGDHLMKYVHFLNGETISQKSKSTFVQFSVKINTMQHDTKLFRRRLSDIIVNRFRHENVQNFFKPFNLQETIDCFQ